MKITYLKFAVFVILSFPLLGFSQTAEEWSYYAPIRYTIAYNEIFKLAHQERRIAILMKPEQFNKKNLESIFELVNKRFPKPVHLYIDIHTSLDTLETPEEVEMAHSSDDARFGKIKENYKSAFYRRDARGESFMYTISLNPYRNEWIPPLTKQP